MEQVAASDGLGFMELFCSIAGLRFVDKRTSDVDLGQEDEWDDVLMTVEARH